VKTALKFRRRCLENAGQEFLKDEVGIFSAMIAAVAGLFFYPYGLTLMFILFSLLAFSASIAWANEMRYYNIEEKTSLSLVASLAFIGGLILVLVGGYFGGVMYIADVQYAQAISKSDDRESAGLLVSAINLNGNDDRYYRTASQTALDLLAGELNNPSEGTAQERTERVQNYTSSAVSLARRATEISPDDTANWANLGEVYQNLLTLVPNADRLSEEAYLKAAELRPNDANYYNRIGMLYLSKFEALRRLSTRASGTTLQQIADEAAISLEKSAEGLRKAIEIAPNFGIAIYNLGAVYDRQNKINEAIVELEKIIPANPSQPGLNFELGLLYYRAGRKNEALEQLQRAVLLAPDYSNARWYMALIYEERGDLEAAIRELETIQSVEVNRDNQTLINKVNDLRGGRVAIPPGRVIDQQPIN
jgi:tetratricopeptide (TPR) repeat protein